MSPPYIVAVSRGDPLSPKTFSGSSYYLFSALQRRGVLSGAVDATPPVGVELVAKAAAVWPQRHIWRERYRFSSVRRAALSICGARRVRALGGHPEAVLQVGGYFRLDGRLAHISTRLRCAYHDSYLVPAVREGAGLVAPQGRHIRRELGAERRVFDGLDLAFVTSEWLRRSLIEDFGQHPDKVAVVGRGTNVDQMPAPDNVARNWEAPRILFVGFDWERKGGNELLTAFRLLRERVPGAELWIVGAAPRQIAAESGIRSYGRIDRSTSAGAAEFERIFRNSTLFVLPSRFDPMPGVVLEAMTYELPCVATRVCGVPEMVEEGRTGLLVSPRDASQLAAAMYELATAPQRCQEMGEAGRRRVLDRFTWDRVADQVIETMQSRLR